MPLPISTPYIFKSQRLGFRQWKQSDVPLFIEMNADERVMEFFTRTKTPEETIELVNKVDIFFQENKFCFYAVDELSSQSFIGFIGFWKPDFEASFTPCVEIGWRLRTEFWNKGLATEGAKRCLEYGFSNLKFSSVYSFTAKLNTRSEKVMKKIGMTKTGEFNHPKVGLSDPLCLHVLYKITKNNNNTKEKMP